ncbi:Outer membrane protein A precursor [Grimontia indica]|uniref:Outer membrane protein A n=1 Tax=Grimontia indica TaxID=1056512 RepID=R1GRN2_9GAMM|nr:MULTISPECIES: OmpA family protein [Grimontia]EOD78759.1 Outer membrane protein A precursor [Grimontia indica]
MKATFTLPALFIALSSVAMPTLASNISATVFEDICSDKQTEVRFKIDVGQSTDVFFHKAHYLQLERQTNAFPTTPIFINALLNAGLNKECAELLVRETPKIEQGKSGLIAKVHFGFDKSSLTPTGKKILARIVDSIKTSSTPLSITGHTDSVGSHAYNLTLGLKRAESVKGYLVDAGGDKKQLKTVSAGETKPAQSNKTAAGRTENRRVEVVAVPLPNTAESK